jgi:hypothetical protein
MSALLRARPPSPLPLPPVMLPCPGCPQVWCTRCSVRQVLARGASVFATSCPSCSGQCCCADRTGPTVRGGAPPPLCTRPRGTHCYRRCTAGGSGLPEPPSPLPEAAALAIVQPLLRAVQSARGRAGGGGWGGAGGNTGRKRKRGTAASPPPAAKLPPAAPAPAPLGRLLDVLALLASVHPLEGEEEEGEIIALAAHCAHTPAFCSCCSSEGEEAEAPRSRTHWACGEGEEGLAEFLAARARA